MVMKWCRHCGDDFYDPKGCSSSPDGKHHAARRLVDENMGARRKITKSEKRPLA